MEHWKYDCIYETDNIKHETLKVITLNFNQVSKSFIKA